VGALPPHVLDAHVDDAFEPKQRAHRSSRHAVLPRSSLRDDALLSHAPRQQRLPDTVVDLVRPRMQQVFPLEINLRASQRLTQPLRVVQRRWTPRIVMQQIRQLRLKRRIPRRLAVSPLQFLQRRHQDLRDKPPPIRPEVPCRVRLRRYHVASRAAFTKARTLSWSLIPGAVSSFELASTPQGSAMRIA